ncbi:hypothetical protein FOA52_001172 [Chlamydomonas sp. UWO 241]|nr:hypothetical protein FOA52_001172 [Chlamydomonas sp. UWO 241]
MTFRVVAEYPHDQDAFTQGLEHDLVCDEQKTCTDVFWESTGMYGRSTVRKVSVSDGALLERHDLPRASFGEGITRMSDTLYQITWMKPDGFMYSTKGLAPLGTFKTELKDGWGLANDGRYLLATDSGHNVYYIDPQDGFKTVKTVVVKSMGSPLAWINELEFVNSTLLANVWQTECIARIDLTSGHVTHWYLMHGLRGTLAARPSTKPQIDVLNGIAWDARRSRLFVTGKYWPTVFEVELVEFEAGHAPSMDEVTRKVMDTSQASPV